MDISNEKIRNAITACSFFAGLSEKAVENLAKKMEFIYLKPHECLFLHGSKSDALYILIEGTLLTFVIKSTGNKIVVGTVSPIETVGELGALSGEPRSLTVESLHESTLLKLPAEDFKALCEHEPTVLTSLSKLIIDRALQTIRLVTHDKPSYRITIIMSLIRDLPLDAIKAQAKRSLTDYDFDLISNDELSFEQIRNYMNTCEHEHKPVFLFMAKWQREIINFCLDKPTHLYLIFKSEDDTHIHPETEQVLEYIRNYSQLHTDLILLHNKQEKIQGTKRFLSLANFSIHHHLHIDQIEDYQRVARFMTGNAFTLVLGGGGAKGMAHLSVIKAMLDKKIPIDAIGGTSIGSVFAACYAMATTYSEAYGYADRFKSCSTVGVSYKNLTWPVISIYSSSAVTNVLRELFGDLKIEDLRIPYFAITSDLTDKKEVVNKTGSLFSITRSSIALPGIFPPLVDDHHLIVDGGLLNNLPVDRMREMIGPDNMIIASSLSRADKKEGQYFFPLIVTPFQAVKAWLGFSRKQYSFPPYFETFLEALLLGSTANEVNNYKAADIIVRPDLSNFSLLGMTKIIEDKLLKIGYDEAIKSLDQYLKEHPEYKK